MRNPNVTDLDTTVPMSEHEVREAVESRRCVPPLTRYCAAPFLGTAHRHRSARSAWC